jgi:hypothetical protein
VDIREAGYIVRDNVVGWIGGLIKLKGGKRNMETIIIKTQIEFDGLPDSFLEYTEIRIVGELDRINKNFKNAYLSVSDSATIKYVYGSATIKYVYGSATIKYVYGSATIKSVSDSATIKYVYGSATIEYVSGSATIKYVSGSATIKYVSDSATIKSVSDSATIESVSDSATIEYVSGSATIESVSDSATIESVSDSATIEYVSMNTIIRIISDSATIVIAQQQAVLVYQNCKGDPKKKDVTVQVIRTQKATYALENFVGIYNVQKVSKYSKKIILYKYVKHDYTDFYSGKIKYEVGKTVEAPDWNADNDIECGGGLHLSSSIEHCKRFNNSKDGHALQCEVLIADIVVHPSPVFPFKIRCKKCFVVKEIENK